MNKQLDTIKKAKTKKEAEKANDVVLLSIWNKLQEQKISLKEAFSLADKSWNTLKEWERNDKWQK